MHQAESSSSSFCLWTGLSLPVALHPASRRRSCLPLRTDQCFCPIGTFTWTFTLLLVRTLRRTPFAPLALPPVTNPPYLRAVRDGSDLTDRDSEFRIPNTQRGKHGRTGRLFFPDTGNDNRHFFAILDRETSRQMR
jgi:hypothetical protein